MPGGMPLNGDRSMSVVVLMYHHTPEGGADDLFDVSFQDFRAQIQGLINAGVSFIRFSECNDPKYINQGTHVALTFDDGHRSNAKAFAYLADRNIVPTAMIVRDWSRDDRNFLSAAAIADLKHVCDFGAHGASHVDLTSLDAADLSRELVSSREYLEETLGAAVTAMALPGGMGNARVILAARREGYRFVGNSIPLNHVRADVSVNRVCLYRHSGVSEPLRLARAERSYWLRARAKVTISTYGPRIVGDGNYRAIAGLLKSRLG